MKKQGLTPPARRVRRNVMTETGHATTHDAAHDLRVKAYFTVFIALSIFTAISFLANEAVRQKWIGLHTSVIIIMVVAVIKAFLVGLIFMHLNFDWGKVYFIIVPIFILGVMMMMVLMPDIVIPWQQSQQPLEPPVSTTGTR
jgi:heme/copper-type cytochrome/quinol oxidase subunit 4